MEIGKAEAVPGFSAVGLVAVRSMAFKGMTVATMTLNMDERHMEALEALAAEQDMSKTALMRQALRLYQAVHLRAKAGEQLAFIKDGKVVLQIVIGLPALD